MIPVALIDPAESTLPAMGTVWVEDPETGEVMLVDTGRRARRRFAAQRHGVTRSFTAERIPKIHRVKPRVASGQGDPRPVRTRSADRPESGPLRRYAAGPVCR